MVLFEPRYFRYFDWLSFLIMLLLSSIGLLCVFSATYSPDLPYSLFFKKQLFGILSGIGIYFVFCIIDYRALLRQGYWIYVAVIALLALTILKGSIRMGGQRWINLGLFKFQPSELAKLFVPAWITFYFQAHQEYTLRAARIQDYFVPLGILACSFILIAKQPDLGTALLVMITGLLMFWIVGMPQNYCIAGLLIFFVCTPLFWKALKPYQKQRILVFMGEGNSKKERYQIEQSIIAIGSGKMWGKGYLNGTQNKLLFLPESRTDFIFSVLCEEWGFVGALVIILLFFIMFWRWYAIIVTIKHSFTQLLAIGLVLPFMLATVINICMVMSLMPAVGIPLPLISYGITHLWVTFAALGWFQSIAIRRFYTG